MTQTKKQKLVTPGYVILCFAYFAAQFGYSMTSSNITKYAKFWLMEDGKPTRRFNHLCWDGCMFPNSAMTNPQTWNDVLEAMKNVRDACGWR